MVARNIWSHISSMFRGSWCTKANAGLSKCVGRPCRQHANQIEKRTGFLGLIPLYSHPIHTFSITGLTLDKAAQMLLDDVATSFTALFLHCLRATIAIPDARWTRWILEPSLVLSTQKGRANSTDSFLNRVQVVNQRHIPGQEQNRR